MAESAMRITQSRVTTSLTFYDALFGLDDLVEQMGEMSRFALKQGKKGSQMSRREEA